MAAAAPSQASMRLLSLSGRLRSGQASGWAQPRAPLAKPDRLVLKWAYRVSLGPAALHLDYCWPRSARDDLIAEFNLAEPDPKSIRASQPASQPTG